MTVNSEDDPFGQVRDDQNRNVPSPREVSAFHDQADTDASVFAGHHTLGFRHHQAAFGDHTHNGKDSKLITALTGPLTLTGDLTITGALAVTGISTLTGLLNANGGIDVDGDTDTIEWGSRLMPRMVKAKGFDGTTATTTIGTTDTLLSKANIVNVPVVNGRAYLALITCDYRNNNTSGRLDWKLWNGSVGGTQVGGTARKHTPVASGSNYSQEVMHFIWGATTTETIANLNLSAVKVAVTAGAANHEYNGGYTAAVFEIGRTSDVTGL